jgi:hypothetical protein
MAAQPCSPAETLEEWHEQHPEVEFEDDTEAKYCAFARPHQGPMRRRDLTGL